MEIHGEPTGASNALVRFQQLREAAQHRLTGPAGREGLARAIEEKQREIQTAAGGNSRIHSTRVSPADTGSALLHSASETTGQTLRKVNELLLYGRDTSLKKESAGPKVLGNYVDRMA